jgi:hypothetical protein
MEVLANVRSHCIKKPIQMRFHSTHAYIYIYVYTNNEPVEPCVEANEPAAHATAAASPELGQADPAGHTRGSASSTLSAAGQ